jgi:hypothetical protein
MLTILSIGLSAFLALRSYNRSMDENPQATTATVNRATQSLAVVITVAEAIWAIFEALRSRTRGRFSGGDRPSTPLRPSSATFGSNIGPPDGQD